MSRLVTVTVRSLSLFLGLAGLAAAQEPPPLEPPSLEPPRTGVSPPRQPEAGPKPVGTQPVAPTPPAAIRPTPPKPENRPMLAIPGVTAPASRPPAAFRPPVAGPIAPGNSVSAPSLDALPFSSDFPPARSPSDRLGSPSPGLGRRHRSMTCRRVRNSPRSGGPRPVP